MPTPSVIFREGDAWLEQILRAESLTTSLTYRRAVLGEAVQRMAELARGRGMEIVFMDAINMPISDAIMIRAQCRPMLDLPF